MSSKGRLAGKTILITGAAQNIARGAALACLKEGAEVVAVDIQDEKLAQLQSEFPAIRIEHLDITNEEQVKSVINKYTTQSGVTKNVNVLFNCVGWVHLGQAHTTTVEDWDRSFDINVKGMFFMSKYIIQKWLEYNVSGNIINMASVTSSVKGVLDRFAYGASKAAVIGLTKSIAVDYVEKGIRANAICPGTVDTSDLHDEEYLKACGDGDSERGWRLLCNRQKMGRLGKIDEIAALVVYLASEESAFITGTEMKIDGGWSL